MIAGFVTRRSSPGVAGVAGLATPGGAPERNDKRPPVLGYQLPTNAYHALVIDVYQAPDPGNPPRDFRYAEVWWRRVVSPIPVTPPTFNDVPYGSPYYQFIEAFAASGITAGCGGGNYCPDSPVTRGQMAVFLAKALGLHWPL